MAKKIDRSPAYATAMISIPLLVREETNKRLTTPEDISELCKEMKDYAQEVFVVVLLDGKNKLITKTVVTQGLLDATMVHPREIFRMAIERSASALILVHNHPSGDPTPSAEDLRITKQLIQAGKIIDIKVLDHLIIGHDQERKIKHLSLRDSGVIQF